MGGLTNAHTTGRAPSAFGTALHDRIEHTARDAGVLLSALRIRLTSPDASAPPAPTLAQACAHADGRPVRVQLAAASPELAADGLVERMRERLSASAHGWTPRPWPDPAREATLGPLLATTAHGNLVRTKTCRLLSTPMQIAVAMMDALDYDIHLFTDAATGQEAAVHRSGPTGYRLSRLHPGAPPHHTALPLVLDPNPAPRLALAAAVSRLNGEGVPFLFFADPDTGRGRVLYRRYDGAFTLLTGTE